MLDNLLAGEGFALAQGSDGYDIALRDELHVSSRTRERLIQVIGM
jgi:hypothetical protein